MEKINIAELLKDCPKGMELDCTMFDDVKFIGVEEYDRPICIKAGDIYRYLTKFGTWTFDENAKCVIFPKGKTTWEGFVPFVAGDVIYTDNFIAILSHITKDGVVWYHCYYYIPSKTFKVKRDFGIGNINYGEFRLATEEEKQKLFDAIKANGYKWNPKTKTLEKLVKPNFKVGDKIEIYGYKYTITEIKDNYYLTKCGNKIPIDCQDDFSLVPNKFDITTLKPFDNCKYSLDGGKTWKFAQYWYVQDKYDVNEIEIDLWLN